MTYETLLVDAKDGVATVTLNRPEAMNAWNDRMAAELTRALRACDEDDAVRAVVLTGAGRAFCAGADISPRGDTFGRQAVDGGERPPEPFYPYQLRKPVIAALNGHAIGVGITYPMLCDVRIVAEDAKIQFAFVRRGVAPELASHVIVPRVVGLSRAAELLLSGRMISGREAAAIGLASEALPRDEVLPAAIERALDFANAAPVAVALSKRLLWEGLTASVPDMMAREFRVFRWASSQPDAKEGVLAFLEKRPPAWKLRAPADVPDL
jgi:enoyl-CoA hydratase/carnithine racemase